MNSTDNSSRGHVEQKLTAARTRLILDKPFLGALVLRLPLIEASQWCATSGTDAKSIYYNHDYINDLSLAQVQFVLAHEALHCGLSHFARRDHRDRKRWDVACDHAVNQLLAEDELEPPQGSLFNTDYAGMSAEEIYPCIDPDDNEQPMDQHLYDPDLDTENDDHTDSDDSADSNSETQSQETDHDREDNQNADEQSTASQPDNSSQPNSSSPSGMPQSGPPPPLNNQERDRLDTQWQQRLAGAAQQAAQAGKLSESIARMLDRLLQPTLPWRALLARYMSGAARVDYNLTRPSRRREGDAILPSLHTRQIDVAVALDTSGSVKEDELNEFLTELNAIKGSMNARVTLLACDETLDDNGPWIYEPWDPMNLPEQIDGGGLTDFTPVFSYLSSHVPQPDLLIYFTDAKGRFPDQRPFLPVLWLVKGGGTVPWGQRIQLN